MAGQYSESLKRKLVQRLLRPNGPSIDELAAEVGISRSTLYLWKTSLGNVAGMHGDGDDNTEKPPSLRPEDWTPEERLQAVMKASGLEGEELGKFLRHEGLHEETLTEWREVMLDALQPARVRAQERKRIAKLERELARKDKALATANALIELQKKVQAIWGGGDDDTQGTTDE